MARYVDADELLREISFYADRPTKSAMDTIKGMALKPNPDVVKVVRCKDCAFCEDPRYRGNAKVNDNIKFCCQGMEPVLVRDDFFCASGTTLEEFNE